MSKNNKNIGQGENSAAGGAPSRLSLAQCRPGDHICCIYQTEEEHRAVLTGFLSQGLERGDKMLYIVDAHSAETVLGYLRQVEVEARLGRGQLAILNRDDAYMREGVFDPDRMIALLAAETERALAEGYPALRVTGEMTWALRGLPGSEGLIDYEARLNKFFPGSKCLAICQYDRRRFEASLLLDVIRTHPIVAFGTDLYDNFYYIPPTDLLGQDRPAVELHHWLQNLAKHQRVEEALRESEARYRSVYDTAPLAFVVWDNNCRITDWNKRAEEFFGWSAEEVLGRNFFEFLIPETARPQVEAVAEALLRGELPSHSINENLTKSGEIITCEWNNSLLRDTAGKVTGVISLALDITERKRAEQQQRRLGRIHQVLAERLPGEALERVFALLGEWLPIDCAGLVVIEEGEVRVESLWVRPGWEEAVARISQESKALAATLMMEGRNLHKMGGALAQTIRSNMPVYLSHLHQRSTPAAEILGRHGMGSALVLPLIGRPELSILLLLGCGQAEALNQAQRHSLEALASSTLRAVAEAWWYEQELKEANATLEERVRRRTFELEVLYDMADKLGHTLSYDELFRGIAEHLRRALRYDIVAALLSVGGSTEIYLYPERPLAQEPAEQLQARLMETWSLMRGKPLDPCDLNLRAGEAKYPELPPIQKLGSVFQVPLIAGAERQSIGVLLVGAERQGAFGEAEVRLLHLVLAQASISIERLGALLASEQQRLEALMERLPEGVLLLNSQRRLVLANPLAREHLSALTDAMVGDVIEALGGVSLSRLLAPAPGERGWHELVVGGAEPRVFEVSSRSVQSGPEKGGWVVVIRDMTAERQVQERAEQQDRLAAVGQLAAGIAHDFNNLLTPIIGYAAMYKDSPDLPPQLRDDLQVVYEQGSRAAQLIRQILDFSRKSMVQTGALYLVPFLKETIKMLQRTIPENIKIELEIEPGQYVLQANMVQLQQAITNLAVNARDAMPEGGELRVRVFRKTLEPEDRGPLAEMSPRDLVVLEFSDTGVGMSPEVMEHIFEPFFTTKHRTEGTGLGLSQLYGIVKQHQGYVDVKSQPGKGSTFTIYLPSSEQEESQGIATGTGREQEGLPLGKGETILVVEDDASVRETVKKLVEKLGYRALAAGNGREGLRIFEEHKQEIRVVLIDMVMPEMGGAELAAALRERDPQVKIIVTSGYPLGEESLPEGIDSWLLKPIDTKTLATAVARAIAANHAQSSSSSTSDQLTGPQ